VTDAPDRPACAAGGTDGASITLLAAGTCTVQADQAGDATYAPAPSVTRSFAVVLEKQKITVDKPANATLVDSPLVVSATASSGLAVAFTTSTREVCTAAGADGSARSWPPASAPSPRANPATAPTSPPTR
jgi:hypothetical protein